MIWSGVMQKILVLHGPNLNLLGEREPHVYGKITLETINKMIEIEAKKNGLETKIIQSNHEGVLIDAIQEARTWAQGIIINPGALSHYSYALRDAIIASSLPTIEVHLTNLHTREQFRQTSVTAGACIGQIQGLGAKVYVLAITALIMHLCDLEKS